MSKNGERIYLGRLDYFRGLTWKKETPKNKTRTNHIPKEVGLTCNKQGYCSNGKGTQFKVEEVFYYIEGRNLSMSDSEFYMTFERYNEENRPEQIRVRKPSLELISSA